MRYVYVLYKVYEQKESSFSLVYTIFKYEEDANKERDKLNELANKNNDNFRFVVGNCQFKN